jgi:hypothetical protein
MSYGATKAGIVGMTRTAALELAGDGITVNCIAPGPVETELFAENRVIGFGRFTDYIGIIVDKFNIFNVHFFQNDIPDRLNDLPFLLVYGKHDPGERLADIDIDLVLDPFNGTGTTGAAYAYDNAPEDARIREFDEEAAIILSLGAGEVDAVLQDFPANAHRAQENPDQFTVTETFPTGEQYGFAVEQGNTALLDAINEQLAAMRDDGTYDEIFELYFGEPPS